MAVWHNELRFIAGGCQRRGHLCPEPRLFVEVPSVADSRCPGDPPADLADADAPQARSLPCHSYRYDADRFVVKHYVKRARGVRSPAEHPGA